MVTADRPMCSTNLFLPRAPFLVLLIHSRKRYPPRKFGSRSRHFPSTPNSRPRCRGNSAPRYPNGPQHSLMLTPKCITAGTRECPALPISRGASILLPVSRGYSPSPDQTSHPSKTRPAPLGTRGCAGPPLHRTPRGTGRHRASPGTGRRHRDPRRDTRGRPCPPSPSPRVRLFLGF